MKKILTCAMPKIHGLVSRRILVNFAVDPHIAQTLIPDIFRPKLISGKALVGICIIRLEQMRPFFVPKSFGVCSENVAHRIAVEWTENGSLKEGVFIFRRDSNSLLHQMVGGRIFPGVHNKAEFTVNENENDYHINILSSDQEIQIEVQGTVCETLPNGSVFESLEDASNFFSTGSLGYSPSHTADRLEGMELQTKEWKMEPMTISKVSSSFFNDHNRFPEGSIEFDSALIMRNLEHEWHDRGELCIGDCT